MNARRPMLSRPSESVSSERDVQPENASVGMDLMPLPSVMLLSEVLP